MKRRVADIIMDILGEYHITDCFAVVGGGAMYLDNALLKCKRLHKYFNHHEQACAMAAEAYARYSGEMALVCVTSGPGTTNALTGVMGAWQDSLPMLVLSGQVRYDISVSKSGLPLRYRGIQEFQIIPVVKNMTKYAHMITDALSIRRELAFAIHMAMNGRRGPVWLDIPQDIQSAVIDTEQLYPEYPEYSPYDSSSIYKGIHKIAQGLLSAKRPCILAGSGIISSNLRKEFVSFVQKLNIPVVGGSWVADIFYTDHSLFYGLSGNIGPRTGNFIIQNADMIIVLASSLGFRQTGFNQTGFAPEADIYMVDADPSEAKKPGLKIKEYIYADLRNFFQVAEKTIWQPPDIVQWISYCDRLRDRFSPFEGADDIDMNERVCAYYFWKVFQKYEARDSVLALGNNSANTAKLQIGVQKADQRVLTNYNCGSMGYDLPAAIGAAVASKKKVYCITGDGSIMMNLQELQTIAHNRLPIQIAVFSNNGYGAIRQTCKNFFGGEYIGCTPDSGISFPNFEKIADTFGYHYICCHTNAEVETCIKQFARSKENVFMEILQKIDDPIIPKVMSRIDKGGKMKSPALQDMYPFLTVQDQKKLMYGGER